MISLQLSIASNKGKEVEREIGRMSIQCVT